MDSFMFLPLSFLAILVTIGSFVILIIIKNKQGQSFNLTVKNLFIFYLYFMTFVSLIMLALGVSSLIKSGMAKTVGAEWISSEFRYLEMNQTSCADMWIEKGITGTEEQKNQIQRCEEEQARQKKETEQRKQNLWKELLLNGLTFTLMGGLVFLLHLVGLKNITKEPDSHLMYQLFLVYAAIFFGIGAIYMLSTGLYSWLYYLLLNVNLSTFSGPTPGEVLPVGIVFLPIWLLAIKALLKDLKHTV